MSLQDQQAHQMDADMLGEAQDTLSDLEVMISNMQSGVHETQHGLEDVLRQAQRIKSLGFTTDFPLIDLTLHRLINYVDIVNAMTDARYSDLQTFLDILRGLLEGTIANDGDQAEFVRSLPVARAIDVTDLESLNIEILLVDPQRMSARIFERELRSGGYRVTLSNRSFEALELAVRTKPDLVITSFEIDELSGVDIARSLNAIAATSAIPVALLTSYDKASHGMKHLPESTGFIRKDANFGEDLATVLEQAGIV